MALKTDINYILLDLKSHWLHGASIIWRLERKWLSREKEEQRVGQHSHSLVVAGSRAGTESS